MKHVDTAELRMVRWIESDGSKHEREFPTHTTAVLFTLAIFDPPQMYKDVIAIELDRIETPHIDDVPCQMCGSMTVYHRGIMYCLNCGATHDVPAFAITHK